VASQFYASTISTREEPREPYKVTSLKMKQFHENSILLSKLVMIAEGK